MERSRSTTSSSAQYKEPHVLKGKRMVRAAGETQVVYIDDSYEDEETYSDEDGDEEAYDNEEEDSDGEQETDHDSRSLHNRSQIPTNKRHGQKLHRSTHSVDQPIFDKSSISLPNFKLPTLDTIGQNRSTGFVPSVHASHQNDTMLRILNNMTISDDQSGDALKDRKLLALQPLKFLSSQRQDIGQITVAEERGKGKDGWAWYDAEAKKSLNVAASTTYQKQGPRSEGQLFSNIQSSYIATQKQQQNGQQEQDNSVSNRGVSLSEVEISYPRGLGYNLASDISTPCGVDDRISALEAKLKDLKVVQGQYRTPRYQILYRLHRSTRSSQRSTSRIYFDHPEWTFGENASKILQSRLPMSNLRSYLEKKSDITFLVYRDFDIDDHLSSRSKFPSTFEGEDIIPPARHHQESIVPVSEDLQNALLTLFKSNFEFSNLYESFRHNNELAAPYVFAYHSRDHRNLAQFTSQIRALLAQMFDYIYGEFGEDYTAADKLFSRGYVSLQYIKYLFKPGDILIKGENEEAQAYIATTWPPYSKYNQAPISEHSTGKKFI